jgi:hypothetical protein
VYTFPRLSVHVGAVPEFVPEFDAKIRLPAATVASDIVVDAVELM